MKPQTQTVVAVPRWLWLLGVLLVLPWLLLYAVVWSLVQVVALAVQLAEASRGRK